MAREWIERLTCDRHLDNAGERVAGETVTVLGGDGRLVEMELCAACGDDVLGPAYAAAARYGREPEKPQRPSGINPRAVVCATEFGGCGKAYIEIRQHIRERHPGMDPDTVAPRKRRQPVSPGPCPECGRTFDTPQGLAAHQRSSHPVMDGRTAAAV
jgi:hypothetical protein